MVGLIYSYNKVTIDGYHQYNTASLVCSDISSHSYYDSPDKRTCREKKTSLTIEIPADNR